MLIPSFWLSATLLSAFAHGHGHLPNPPPVGQAIGQATFTNTVRLLFDVDGNQIDAYGAKINWFNGSYYLYGNSFSITGLAFAIKSYSSNDLINWAFAGYLYDAYAPNPCNAAGGCGRPHILYHQKSQKYILWTNAGSNGYVIATSSVPFTNFVFSNSTASIDPKFAGLQPADFAVEDLGNNEAYIVFSALNYRLPQTGSIWPPILQSLHISPLTDDFMNTTGVSYDVTSSAFDLVDQETESPDIFKRDGIYYVSASNTCGYCNGSLGIIYRSASIQGPWTRQILSGDSCQAQVEGVLPLTDPNSNYTTYLWHSTSVPGPTRAGFSGHIFQPLRFAPDGSVHNLDCDENARFSVKFTPGTGPAPTGPEVFPNRAVGSPPIAAYKPVCDSDQFTVIQTWVQPTSGTITGLSLNAARSVQTATLDIGVFKFSNLNDLISPGYKYESLGTSNVNVTRLSYTFDTTFVPLNAAVSAGDHLGFLVNGADFAPYCHLEYDVGHWDNWDNGMVLLQKGLGQASFRGWNGKASPIYVREGKGIKFFISME